MRVVIAEDEVLVREGLAAVLGQAGMEVVAAVPDADRLLRAVGEHRPALVVTDLRMPPTHTDEGLRAALRLRAEAPEVGVVLLTQHVQRLVALDLVGDRPAGVGYLLKQRVTDVEAFCRDLRRVGEGGTALDPEVVSIMLARAARTDDGLDALTPRQREVLALVAEGRSNAAIAQALVITEKAVVRHVSQIYDALGLPPSPDDHRRVLAVIRYLSRDGQP